MEKFKNITVVVISSILLSASGYYAGRKVAYAEFEKPWETIVNTIGFCERENAMLRSALERAYVGQKKESE